MSLLETTKKEGTPVSGVQTISGHGLATSNLPKRPWSAYNTTSLRKGNAISTPPTTRVIRSPKSRTTPLGVSAEASQPRARTQSTNSSDAMDPAAVASSKAESTEKEQEGLQEFLSMLAAKQSNWTEDKVSDDTIDNRIDSLIEMMKAHHISEPTNPIPVNGNRETSQSTPSSIPLTAPTFDFTFDSKSFVNGKAKLKDSKGGSSLKEQVTHLSATNLPNNQEIQPTSSSKSTKPAKPTQKTSTMPTSDFQFSFNATTPLRDNAKFTTSDISRPPAAQHDGFSAPRLLRRMSDVQSMYTSHPMHQALYHVPILEDSTKVSTKTEQTEFGDEEDYGSDEGDNNEKQAGLPSMEGDKATHNEHRRILPLPKPRSKRKASKQVQSAAATYMANLSTSDATDTIVSASRQISAFAPFLSQISTSRDNRQQSTAKSSDTALPDGDWGISQLSLSDDTLSLGNANTMTAFGNKNTLLEHEIHYAGESSDASYRDNAKKMKRSAGGDGRSSSVHTTDVAAVRRKDRKWRTITEDRGMLASVEVSGSRFPERSFHFAMDARTREKLKQLPKMEDLPRSAPALNLSSVLRQTLSSIQSRQPAAISTARQVRQRKGDLFGTANTLLRNEPPFPAGGTAKKKGKVTSTVSDATATVRTDRPGAPAGNSASSSLHTGRRNKKSNRKKKGDEDSGQSNNVSSSDIAVVRSPDPDEWICVFCQYEIFCRGLEAARRKGGYYRRRRERARRLREAEARRAGEPLSGVASDVEDDRAADDHQSFLAPGAPTMGTIPSMGPPLADQQQRPLRRGNRAA